MSLTQDEVKKIAQLARIALTPEEVEQYQEELSSILAFVEQLKAVDTSQVEATHQVTGLENHTRSDNVNYEFTRAQMLASAIKTAADHLEVKSVFKRNT